MKSLPTKIPLKSGQRVFDKEYGHGVVAAQCGNIFTVSFNNKVAYYDGNGTELGSNMRGDRVNALDNHDIKENICSVGNFIKRWLSGSKT